MTSRSCQRHRPAILGCVLAGLVLASSLGSPSGGQEENPDGAGVPGPAGVPIVVQPPDPEDSADHVTLVVRGMMKSRSGAT